MTSDTPAHLQPLRRRTGAPVKPAAPSRAGVAAGAPVLIAHAVDVFLGDPKVAWRKTTRKGAKYYLASGRFPAFCDAEGLSTLDDLTTDKLGDFLGQLEELGASREYRAKYRQNFRRFAEWCAKTPGYGIGGMKDIERIEPITVPRQRFRKGLAWSKADEPRVVAAAEERGADGKPTRLGKRDRLIVEFGLATGARPSEIAGVLLNDVDLDRRPPRVHIAGSIHDEDPNAAPGDVRRDRMTKSSRGRQARDRMVNFRPPYNQGLPSRLARWIAEDRDSSGRNPDRHLFLSLTTGGPLTVSGLDQLYQRIQAELGLRCFPYMARHTWATRLANATPPVPPAVLMMQGGWETMDMVLQYYEADVEEAARVIEAASV
jgi:integrase